jgi:hypothetical protein
MGERTKEPLGGLSRGETNHPAPSPTGYVNERSREGIRLSFRPFWPLSPPEDRRFTRTASLVFLGERTRGYFFPAFGAALNSAALIFLTVPADSKT